MPRALIAVGILLFALVGASSASWQDPLEPPRTGGIELVDRALARLTVHARVLVVGAHPDDEDSSLLTLVAGMGGEAAYFSLSRGEGGQNLIGPELGVGLGLIRTEELLGARRIEGNRQFFSRAYDFGYTRSLDETLARWPKGMLLEDAARVVREFKPQVIVSIFRNGGGGTHGQHQAAGVVAHEIFDLAGDQEFLGEQAAEGLHPWTPQALYRRAAWWRGEEEGTIEVKLDGANPVSGRGWGQVAAASRSMHRSQDMGRMQTPGGARSAVVWVEGGAGAESSGLFDGVDTQLAAISDLLADPDRRDRVRGLLEDVQAEAEELRDQLSPVGLQRVVPALKELRGHLAVAEKTSGEGGDSSGSVAAALIAEKRTIAEEALLAAAGIAIDARADRERVAPGQSVEVTATVWNSGHAAARLVEARLVGHHGWPSLPLLEDSTPAEDRFASSSGLTQRSRTIELLADVPPTLPYFLSGARNGDVYDWSGAESYIRTHGFAPPPLAIEFLLEIEGIQLRTVREVVFAYADQALGEVRRPLQVVPELEVEARPRLVLRPTATRAPTVVGVQIRSNAEGAISGRVEVETPADWPAVEVTDFIIEDAGGGDAVELAVDVPAGVATGRYRLPVSAVPESGSRFSGAYPTIEYEHVRPRPRFEASVVELEVLELALPAVERVAWVRGASDAVSDALVELGLPIDVFDARSVAASDLADYDTVVIGSRAYETDAALGRVNEKLLDYARAGGTLIVNYQQYQFSRGGFAPYEFEIGRPHDRITDESSPVRLLDPDHPVFNHPNRLTDADWDGWVQERGLYFGERWGPEFEALLALKDPDEEETLGGLLVAPLGEGTYVYTGLSFFREIPAGVPGAYRLLANLLALGERP